MEWIVAIIGLFFVLAFAIALMKEGEEHVKEQNRYYNKLIALGERSIDLFESMPNHLSTAEQFLDQAEADFGDSAFAPFWDSIENAAKTLGNFDENTHELKHELKRYSSKCAEFIKKYEDTPPLFPISHQAVAKLDVSKATAQRMQAIVRTAQRDFQFASIYEQRKTNQILVAGFTSLAQALDQMTYQITASIDDLTDSVNVLTSATRVSNEHLEKLSDDASERAEREKKALEMLDNIQRDRKSFL